MSHLGPANGVRPEALHLGGYNLDHDGQGTWAPELWQRLIDDLNIKSMVEIGSGLGDTVRWFRNHGVDALGIDGEQQAHEATGGILHDYTTGPRIVAECDLVWSAEFVEHVEERYLENFMATFRCGRRVGLTHAQPGDAGHHHVNCRSSRYWIKVFEEHGFEHDAFYTRVLKSTVPFHEARCRCVRNSFLYFRRK